MTYSGHSALKEARETAYNAVQSNTKKLYEIMVPTISNEGKPFRTRHHREWDRQVREISNGLTIYTPAKGQWIDEDSGELFVERMIPVRIACTSSEIYIIMEITTNHYDQIDVMAYVVSEEVLFYRAQKKKLK